VTSDQRRLRLAHNERVFRELNEQADRRASQWQENERTFQLVVCECANADCYAEVTVTPAEYRMVRNNEQRFLVAPGHVAPEVERVVYRHDRYWIVEKDPDLAA
jgi:hypothetical protein